MKREGGDDLLFRLATGELSPQAPEAQAAFAREPELLAQWQELRAIADSLGDTGSDVREVLQEGSDVAVSPALRAQLARLVEHELGPRRRTPWLWWLAAGAAAAALIAAGVLVLGGGASPPVIAPFDLHLGNRDDPVPEQRVRRQDLHALRWDARPGVDRYTIALRSIPDIGAARDLMPPQRVALPWVTLAPELVAALPARLQWTVTWIADDGKQESQQGVLELVD
jgi:hypothetical protein